MQRTEEMVIACVIGEKAVGKTALIRAGTSGKFSGWYKEYQESTFSDFVTTDIEVNGENYRFQIWDAVASDMPLNVHFAKTSSSFFKCIPNGAAIYFACFDLNKLSSLDYLDQALTNLPKMQLQSAEVVLVGTKGDLTMDTTESYMEKHALIESFMGKHGIRKYVRSCAKDRDNLYYNLYSVFGETFNSYLAKTLSKAPLPTTVQEDGAEAEVKSASDVQENIAVPEVKSPAAASDDNFELATKLAFNLFKQAKQSWLADHPEAKDAHLCVRLK